MNRNSIAFLLGITCFTVLLLTVAGLTESRAAETVDFQGTWVANGTRKLFPFGEGRKVYTFEISGHVNLESNLGKKKDYWAECVGLSDSVTGAVARCVWKGLDGPVIFLTLQSDRLQQDSLVTGTIVGGTGYLQGVSGELSFVWSTVTFQEDAQGQSTVTGQALDLKGSARIP